MIIYLDVLIVVNAIIDYFLLNIMSLLVRRSINVKRIIIAALLGGISSVYIFFDSKYLILDLAYNMLIGGLMVLLVIGFKDLKRLLYSFGIFMILSFLLSGFIDFMGRNFYGDVFMSEHFIGYINISPIFLILCTAVIYFAISLLRRISDKKTVPKTAKLEICICSHSEEFIGLVDTGNSVTDPFGTSQVFIVDESKYANIKDSVMNNEFYKRKRLIPIKTVGGRAILDAIRCDRAEVLENGKIYAFENPIVAASLEKIDNGYTAIIPSVCLDRISDGK